ncbi:MAG UNVERIFIED_CONTAM: HEAT repeat domain-containing protein [Planctomycetaceae bacterium]
MLQLECLTASGAIGPLARESAPAVARFINSDAAFLQISALDALRQIGHVPAEQVPRVRVLVDAADTAIAVAAARCLISAVDAPDAASAILLQTLVRSLQQARPDVRSEAALGLMEAGPRVVPLVQPLLASDRWPVRFEACRVLAHFNADSVTATPALQKLLQDRVDLVVRAAAEAIGEIDGDAVTSLPLLAELLQRDSSGGKTHRAASHRPFRPPGCRTYSADHSVSESGRTCGTNCRSGSSAGHWQRQPRCHRSTPARAE